ncbi:MAG: phosphatidylserine decarboxylase [Desulfobulbaceae bacterium]|nr:MAG: phosphatidylserine decarboxylase [Desulfobulbaceae bacterium]
MSSLQYPHQYVDRSSGSIITESLIGDRTVSFLYNRMRESAPAMFRALTSGRMSSLLGYVHYDRPSLRSSSGQRLLRKMNVDLGECVHSGSYFDSARKVFERQIKYWQCRPLPNHPHCVVSPADSRVLIGSFDTDSLVFIKEKFFSIKELVGEDHHIKFKNGCFAIFRLTPDKYHYNHFPVSGTIIDTYECNGAYHSCNPVASISLESIYSKNRRIVTLIDTDVPGGTGVGVVAMIEIVALMIGDIVQCASRYRYNDPEPVQKGSFWDVGLPKSLFRPGSSTVVLLFEPNRIKFSADLLENARRMDISSRFSHRFKHPAVETDVLVRSEIAHQLDSK